MCSSIQTVVESYQRFLEVKHPQHFIRFRHRLKSNIASARAEACVFAFLRDHCEFANVNEDPSQGGFDFACSMEGAEMAVEVMALDSETIEDKSGFATAKIEQAQWFQLLTATLRKKVAEKAQQLSDYPGPRLLCLVSEHISASFQLGPTAAEELLAGGTKIAESLGQKDQKAWRRTCLEDAVFFRFENKVVTPCRRSISALLLISASESGLDCVGLLHPDPAVPFSPRLFGSIPFLRVCNWPLENGRLETEWIVGRPKPKRLPLKEVKFTDDELRSGN